MKRILTLAIILLLPLLVFAQTPKYDSETAQKFYEVIDIVDNAIGTFDDSSWWYTGTAAGGDISTSKKRYYDIEKIKSGLKAKGLDTFLKDQNNRIVLAAVANFITYHKRNDYYNDFETLLAVGIDPIEAAVRTSNQNYYLNNALKEGIINYRHCYTQVFIGPYGGHVSAITERITIEVETTEQEVEAIRLQLRNEMPLVEQFENKMKEIKRQGKFFYRVVNSFMRTINSFKEVDLDKVSDFDCLY